MNNDDLSIGEWEAKSFEAMQLFTTHPVEEAGMFSGRRKQIQQLLEVAFQRGKHAVLYGERGVGKTSIAKIFKDLFPDTLRHIFCIRIRAYPHYDFTDLWRKVFEEMTATVTYEDEETPREIQISELYDADIEPDDIRREFERYFRPNDIPIIIVDEYDKLNSEEARIKTSNLIKTLYDDAVNVTVVLVGVTEDVNQLIADHGSLDRCITQVHMPRMTRAEAEDILDKRIPLLGMEIDGEALNRIIILAQGLPYYVHSLALEAVKSACHKKRATVIMNDVDLAINTVLEQQKAMNGDAYYKAVQSSSSRSRHRQSLLACALAQGDDAGYFTPSNVMIPLERLLDRKVKFSDFKNHLDEFASSKRGRILQTKKLGKRRVFKFSEPFMQPYVVMKGFEEKLLNADLIDLLRHDQKTLPI